MSIDPQQPELVAASANVEVATEGRVAMHRMRVAAFEVTEHQLELITVSGQDAGIVFNVFITCGSVAITIFLTLNTTTISDPQTAEWWRGGFVAFIVLALTFFIMWLRKRSLFKDTIKDIKDQRLNQ